MTTKRDLVEAHSFSRRRLVTAFLSGAPGGREVEPTRPGRTILGGVAIAVLLLAGGAIASVLAPRAPQGWSSRGLVVTDQGARYIVTRDKQSLRPVVNLTSAQLILGLQPPTRVVSQKIVDHQTPGTPIGIEGAPEELPTIAHFVETGWTACTSDRAGVAVDVSTAPQVRRFPTTMGLVVDAPSGSWLIAQTSDPGGRPRAYRYRIPAWLKSPLLERAFTGATTEITVPEQWLDLFPAGGALGAAAFPRSGDGRPSTLTDRDGRPLTTGDLATSGDKYFLVRPTGWLALSDFEAQVYRALLDASGKVSTPDTLAGLTQKSPEVMPATSWPGGRLDPTPTQVCAQLDAQPGRAPTVRIGVATGARAWPADPPGAAAVVQTVDPGMGAFVRTGSFGSADATTSYLVDSRGAAFLLEGGTTIASLGLAHYRAPVIPDTWLELLGTGTPLSTERALCPPATEPSRISGTCAPAAS